MLDTISIPAPAAVRPAVEKNPLTASTLASHTPLPCALVIFGAAGDLAWRKLLPAVYNVHVDGVLPTHFADGRQWRTL